MEPQALIWSRFPRGTRHALDDAELSRIVECARGCFRSSIGEVLLYLEENGAKGWHKFFVERPAGEPVIVHSGRFAITCAHHSSVRGGTGRSSGAGYVDYRAQTG